MTAEHMVTICVALLLSMTDVQLESASLAPHRKAKSPSAATMATHPMEINIKLSRPTRIHQGRLNGWSFGLSLLSEAKDDPSKEGRVSTALYIRI
jgi:hypothetical protein